MHLCQKVKRNTYTYLQKVSLDTDPIIKYSIIDNACSFVLWTSKHSGPESCSQVGRAWNFKHSVVTSPEAIPVHPFTY